MLEIFGVKIVVMSLVLGFERLSRDETAGLLTFDFQRTEQNMSNLY